MVGARVLEPLTPEVTRENTPAANAGSIQNLKA
jgi:hypothetical protein